jgi:hypothetical protein
MKRWKHNTDGPRADRILIIRRREFMAKERFRRQVVGLTPKGERITIGHVSSNGVSVTNARAKGCFGSVPKNRGLRRVRS